MLIRLKQNLLILLVTLITVAVIVVIFWTKPSPRLVGREIMSPVVTVSELRSHDVQPWQMVTGHFEPIKTSQLKFEATGRVESRYVEEGRWVEKGQVLFKIDDRDYRDNLKKIQAELNLVVAEVERDKQLLMLARLKRELQEKEVARFENLLSRNLTSRSLIDDAWQKLVNLQSDEAQSQHLVSVATARLDLIRSERDLAKRQLKRSSLVAPFVGVVNSIDLEVGSFVDGNQIALTIVDVSQLDLLLHLNGKLASMSKIGQIVEVEVQKNTTSTEVLNGELVALQVAPDPETFTYEARVRVANDGLRAGMIARARLSQPRRDDVITVPIAAVQYLDGRTYVFVEYDGVLKRIRVSLGARIGNSVIVESGLDSGLRVIVHDVDTLSDGQRVAVRQGANPIH